ncbi:MAG TPA: GDP-mannose 4,6-dehydratase [Anaerolineales bacterium]
MRYLVTGAAGFIGAKVSQFLLEAEHQVVGVDNLNEAYDPRLKSWRLQFLLDRAEFTFHELDILNFDSLEQMWADQRFDAVINLAARAGVRPSVLDPWIYEQTNVKGALNLLELARRNQVPKFLLASTSSLYGLNNQRPFAETANTSRPLSPYAASKGAAEMLAHSYHHLHGLDVSVLRYFTVYGPAGRPDMSVFRFIQWIAEGRPLRLYGDGSQERDYTFVDDIARGTIAALRSTGFEIFNLGGNQPVSILDVIHQVEAILGKQAMIEQSGPAPGDVPATWADISKARQQLGWQPQVPLAEGLPRTVAWYLEERDWARQVDTSDL